MQKMPEPREEGRQGGKTLCKAARGKSLDVPGVLGSGRRRDTEEATSGGAAAAWQAREAKGPTGDGPDHAGGIAEVVRRARIEHLRQSPLFS